MSRLKGIVFSLFLVVVLCYSNTSSAQIRFYLDYSNIPFLKGSTNNFKVLTGFKLDPNKELVLGIGLRGRFNPTKLDGDLRFSQSNYSIGFNYYYSRRLYFNADLSMSLLKDVLSDITNNPIDLQQELYLNYRINVTFVALRRLHFSTGMSVADFSKLLTDVGESIINLEPTQVNLVFSLRLYLFQIKT